jgi:hypothetical protein
VDADRHPAPVAGGQVGLVLAATLLWSAAVSALVTWWSGPTNALYGNRFESAQFDTQNLVPLAFALFAVALGLAVGSWLRRTLPALAATVGGYAALRLAVAVYSPPSVRPGTARASRGVSTASAITWF